MSRAIRVAFGIGALAFSAGCRSVSYVQPFPPPPPPPPVLVAACPPPAPVFVPAYLPAKPHGHFETRRVVVGHDACGRAVIGLRRVWIAG